MSISSFFKKETKEFTSQCISYLVLFFSMNVMLYISTGLFDFSASMILKFQRIPYISYTNLMVLIQKPIATILLFILFIFLIISIFFQFAYLLLGIRQIRQRRFQILSLIKESWASVCHQKWGSFGFFFFYFMLILPVSQEIFNTQLLNKVVIPVFIMDFITKNIIFALLIAFIGILIAYIAVRWIFILPLIILEEISVKEAIQKSLVITRKKFWHFSWRFFLLTLFSVGLKYIIFLLFYVLQIWLDTFSNPIPLIGGMINLSLVQLVNAVGGAYTSVLLMTLLMVDPALKSLIQVSENKTILSPVRWLNRLNVFLLFLVCSSVLLFNILFLLGLVQGTPKVISHRGVDSLTHPNGVQNTIPALKKTMALKPDYVEMDIQETKDQQFVMMHDTNLKNLTGVNKTPQQLTLSELTQLIASENNLKAPVSSFDDYLKTANQGKQKLLIEIKTSKYDSSDLVERFINKYKEDIISHHHEVQSLDYEVIAKLKKKAPEISASYILPYNFIFPNTPANTYTMEATTLNASFVVKAHSSNRNVYAWTINDIDTMDKIMFMNVDGIITDELSLLKEEIKNFETSPSYADRIMYYISIIPN